MPQPSNPVNWFEIPVNDMQRAKEFYEHVFGVMLSVQDLGTLKMAWFPMTQGMPGAAGTLVKAESYVPSHAGSMVYFRVDDIDAALKRVGGKGGKTLRAKTSIGQHGFVGHFEDCEGNRIALHSMY
ncbi:MAG: VOC family protein [Gammaproteobacteria bacterium]|nr:VOC family protein [Gammaproteobacteria bacterium]